MNARSTNQFRWPEDTYAQIPLLPDRPPFDFHAGVDLKDRLWRDKLVRLLKQGKTLPRFGGQGVKQVQALDDRVAHRPPG